MHQTVSKKTLGKNFDARLSHFILSTGITLQWLEFYSIETGDISLFNENGRMVNKISHT